MVVDLRSVYSSFPSFDGLPLRIFMVQARIALVNTALTAAGMWTLAIPGLGLLSLFVFICSFIPIAGCFISTVPIAFVALTEYGFLKVRPPVAAGLQGVPCFDLPRPPGTLPYRAMLKVLKVCM